MARFETAEEPDSVEQSKGINPARAEMSLRRIVQSDWMTCIEFNAHHAIGNWLGLKFETDSMKVNIHRIVEIGLKRTARYNLPTSCSHCGEWHHFFLASPLAADNHRPPWHLSPPLLE
jgi:hypothetical protein